MNKIYFFIYYFIVNSILLILPFYIYARIIQKEGNQIKFITYSKYLFPGAFVIALLELIRKISS
jgi:hypothetical protein